MFRELGTNVIAVDLDPQSNLTSAFFDDDALEKLWPDGAHSRTILGAVDKLINRMGDIESFSPEQVVDRMHIIPGDLGLSTFEDRLSQGWRDCLSDNPPDAHDAFRVMSAFYRVTIRAGERCGADVALIDVGPNIGAMNRAALVASDFIVVPLGADLFSLQGLRNLGPTLRSWRSSWKERKQRETAPNDILLPDGSMTPLGYVILNPSVRSNRPVKAYKRWAERIPEVYETEVLGGAFNLGDPNQLAMIKHFKSLMPLSQDARKPMFLLKPADGAIGGHVAAVNECYEQFKSLAIRIADASGICFAQR